MLRSVSALGEPSPAILVGLDDLNRSAGLALMRQPRVTSRQPEPRVP